MPYESSSPFVHAAERVVDTFGNLAERAADTAGNVVDSEHMPPVRWAALGALVGFAVIGSGIVAAQELMESRQDRE